MKFIADLLLDFIISPYTTDNSRKDTEKEKIEPIAISLDLAEERDNLVQDLVKMIIPIADAFDKFCVKAKEKSFSHRFASYRWVYDSSVNQWDR